MSKENPLSHHEQLRYDYLFKISITSTTVNGGSLIICNRKWQVPSLKFTISTKKKKEETWGRDIDLPTYGSRSRSKKREKVAPQPKVKKKKRRIRFKRILTWFLLLITCVLVGMIFMFLRGFSQQPIQQISQLTPRQLK